MSGIGAWYRQFNNEYEYFNEVSAPILVSVSGHPYFRPCNVTYRMYQTFNVASSPAQMLHTHTTTHICANRHTHSHTHTFTFPTHTHTHTDTHTYGPHY